MWEEGNVVWGEEGIVEVDRWDRGWNELGGLVRG